MGLTDSSIFQPSSSKRLIFSSNNAIPSYLQAEVMQSAETQTDSQQQTPQKPQEPQTPQIPQVPLPQSFPRIVFARQQNLPHSCDTETQTAPSTLSPETEKETESSRSSGNLEQLLSDILLRSKCIHPNCKHYLCCIGNCKEDFCTEKELNRHQTICIVRQECDQSWSSDRERTRSRSPAGWRLKANKYREATII